MQDNAKQFKAMVSLYGWRLGKRKVNDIRLYFIRPGIAKNGGKSNACSIYCPDKDVFICYSTSTPFNEGQHYSGEEVLKILSNNKDFDYDAGCRCYQCKTPIGKNIGRDKRNYVFALKKTETAGIIEIKVPVCDKCFNAKSKNTNLKAIEREPTEEEIKDWQEHYRIHAQQSQ